MSGFFATAAAIGMAVGPPLVYVDQYSSIVKTKNSAGFSSDVCGVLIFANITRIFFWLGERFEFPLLVQSFLMIIAQLVLLYVCVKYSSTYAPLPTSLTPTESPPEPEERASRGWWKWEGYGSYIEAIAAYIAAQSVLYLVLWRWKLYIQILGFFALGLESTLPLPQLVTNYHRKSLKGFRWTVLAGWLFGDSFKLLYFILRDAPMQFIVCGGFQLTVDVLILFQAFIYRKNSKVPNYN